jgi:hypothetical protein
MKRQLTRRTVLRGAGVVMGLPWMESFAATAAPKRFCVQFMGCGVNEEQWSARGSGEEMVLSKSLSSLEGMKKKINVIDGLFVKSLTGQGIHPAQTGSLLSGASIQRGPVLRSGVTVDQVGGHAAAEPGAGVRAAVDGVPRDELLDGLQFALVVAEPGFAGADGGVSFAGVRQPV